MEGSRQAKQPDPLTPEQRRHNMSRIRGKDSKPELMLRRALHARGLRYRLHDRRLPGSPDLVFPGYRAGVFVHGCFWHAHDCPKGVTPGTNTAFWQEKMGRNRARDSKASLMLEAEGWRVLTIWECALTGRGRHDMQEIVKHVAAWLAGGSTRGEIAGAFALSIT